jgi:hypothetical protein
LQAFGHPQLRFEEQVEKAEALLKEAPVFRSSEPRVAIVFQSCNDHVPEFALWMIIIPPWIMMPPIICGVVID